MTGDLVTVFGGSGFLGKYVVRALCKAGARVRVAVRRPHLAHELRVMGDVGQVQLVQANVRDRASVARALQGADAAVNLAGIVLEAGRQKFMAVHAEGARNIASAAAETGVGRLVQVSAIGAERDASSALARSKGRGEAFVREGFPSATILRPSVIFGVEDQFFNRFANLLRYWPGFAPVPILFGGGKTRMQPVFVSDVADAVAAALESRQATGRIYELGGPSIYSFRELLRFTLEQIDRPRMLMPAPWFAGHLMGLAGDVIGVLPLVTPMITRDQVRLLQMTSVAGAGGEDVGVLEDLGVTPETIEAIVPSYLERYRRYGQFHERRPA